MCYYYYYTPLSFCNSKRISDHVQDLLKKDESIPKHEQGGGNSRISMLSKVKLDAIMISSEYWPPLNMEEAKWHPSMTMLSEEFQDAYGTSTHLFCSICREPFIKYIKRSQPALICCCFCCCNSAIIIAKSQTMRNLQFRPQLGNVDLEIFFQSGITREYSVSPLHATLILHFQVSYY